MLHYSKLYFPFFQIDNIPYNLVAPDRALYFPSVEEIRTRLREVAAKGQGQIGDLAPVIVDMSQVVEIDYSAAAVSESICIKIEKIVKVTFGAQIDHACK